MNSSIRVSRASVVRLRELLDDRELEIIESVGRLRLLSTGQIQRLHFFSGKPLSSARQCRRHLERLVELRVLTRLERRIGGVRAGSASWIYALGVAGQRLNANNHDRRVRRPWEPSLLFVRHRLAVNELFVKVVESDRAGELELIRFLPEPDCWRKFHGPGGVRQVVKPDGAVWIGAGEFEESYFLEVDLSTESVPALTKKLWLYRRYWLSGREQARNGVFPQVLLIAPSESRKAQLVEAAARQPSDSWPLFRVVLADQVIEVLSGKKLL
jgi:hypothetical protein